MRRCTTTLLAALALTACQPPEDPFAVDEPPADECMDTVVLNQWVFDVMQDYYLWRDIMPTDLAPEDYESPEDYVVALRSEPDRWTRVSDKVTSNALFMEGKFIGLGYKSERMEDDTIRISFVSDNSPASAQGLVRGDKIVAIQGYTIADLDNGDLWGDLYGPDEPGTPVELSVERLASGQTDTFTITKEWIDIVSLPDTAILTAPGGEQVGYFLMDKFVETTKAELDAAYATFQDAGVSKLIIDYRYNGGGLISVAERVVDLSVGAEYEGEMAYRFEYNDNYASENYSVDIAKLDHSIAATDIVFLVSSRSRSATELVINALFPYANVTLVGSTTGGKPVGSKGFDFCDKKLFPITFRLINADGNTDYFDGLPADCYAEDDLFHDFGDPEEAMIAAALQFLGTGTCEQPLPGAPLAIQRDAVGERVLPNAERRDEIDSW
ncbi:S41 family peptidase [Nannocystaceae bacterium ST9]